MKSSRRAMVHVVSASSLLLAAVSSYAASLTKVNQGDWQGGVSLPSYVNMYIYVPDSRTTKPPILVASHHCQGTGTTTYNETKSTFVAQADKNGYIIIFPEATGHNCWDVGSAKALKHDGGGDTHAIAQMVKYTITRYGADASRVYAFGGSSGGMMTQALLGVYPDIFLAGVSVSGVPCGCWAVEYSGDVATNGQWSGPCAGGTVTKTDQAWGDAVRAMYPGYTGHRARVQLWHGDPDGTISFVNFGESIKEWTNVLGLRLSPTKTDNPNTSTSHQTWTNACGVNVLETFAIKGADHAVQWDLATASSFLGLDKAGGQDPEIAACAGAGGAGGMGGASAAGTGSGGSTATGGRSAGVSASGGSKASGASMVGGSASGGSKASGGSNAGGSDASGTTSAGGFAAGGNQATGGSSLGTTSPGTVASGGSSATGTTSDQGGTTANGGPVMTQSATYNGGRTAQGSSVIERSGGAPASGGVTAPSSGGSWIGSDSQGGNPNGCSCAVPGQRSNNASNRLAWLVLGSLAMCLLGRRRCTWTSRGI